MANKECDGPSAQRVGCCGDVVIESHQGTAAVNAFRSCCLSSQPNLSWQTASLYPKQSAESGGTPLPGRGATSPHPRLFEVRITSIWTSDTRS